MTPTYGDAIGELRAITTSSAVVTDAHEVVWVTGPGAVTFLQGIVSQDVAGMAPGTVARSFFLSPQGKLRALLRIARGDEDVALVVDSGGGARLVEDLTYYKIRVKATIRLEDRPIFEEWGPSVGASDRWTADDGRPVIPIPMRGLARRLVIGQVPGSGGRAGRLATTAARVIHGEPVFGVDVDESTIPQETGLVDESVSFTKGCYLGQELVARIDSRGHVNRVLRALAITRNVLPPEGAGVFVDDRQVGSITSVSETFTSPSGLSLLRREVAPGDTVAIRWPGGDAPALVRDVPMSAVTKGE